jgi:DnaJ-class molecular chaperone
MADYYETLGVPRSATVADVRRAYAQLARERHPDRFKDPADRARAEKEFQEITAAFNALSNDRVRTEYDAALDRPRATTPEQIAQETFTRGMEFLERGDTGEAASLFRAAVHQAPSEARYHVALARALAKNSRSAREAIEAMEHAVRLAPENAPFHAELAALLLRQGLSIRARKVAETALKLAPDDLEVRRIAREAGLDDREPPGEGGGLRGLLRRKP